MELTTQSLAALLAEAGLEPRDGDLERFRPLMDKYITSLKALYTVDLGNEEIAPTFDPSWGPK